MKERKAHCIARDCGKAFNPHEPEIRANLRSFWQRYCPDCRTKGNAGQPPIVAVEHLTCCCCGEGTTGRQWYNRDTGYGICGDCIARFRAKHIMPESEIRDLYGIEGQHFNVAVSNV